MIIPEAVRRWLGQNLPDPDYMRGTDERRIIVEWRAALLHEAGVAADEAREP